VPRDAARADDGGGYGAAYREGGRDSRSGRGWDDNREAAWENWQRALPSASDEPSASEWVNRRSGNSAPEPERRRRRYADD
jgi:hypothetical protein